MGRHDSCLYAVTVLEYEDDETVPPPPGCCRTTSSGGWILSRPHHTSPSGSHRSPSCSSGYGGSHRPARPHLQPLEIVDLHRPPATDGHPDPLWHLEGQQFDLRLRAPGYVQYVRRAPQHISRQTLTLGQRGGVSLAEEPFA